MLIESRWISRHNKIPIRNTLSNRRNKYFLSDDDSLELIEIFVSLREFL